MKKSQWSFEVTQKEKNVCYCIYVESGKMVLINLLAGQNRDADVENRRVDIEGFGKEKVRQTGRLGLTCIPCNKYINR